MRLTSGPKTLWIGLIATGILFVPLLLSHTHLSGPPCPFRLSVGLPCPGCGLTRSLMALWHGDWLTSFRYHPLGLPLFVVCVLLLIALLLRRTPRLTELQQRRLLTGVSALLVGIWLVRLTLLAAGSRFFLW
jgi:hypothetical protein